MSTAIEKTLIRAITLVTVLATFLIPLSVKSANEVDLKPDQKLSGRLLSTLLAGAGQSNSSSPFTKIQDLDPNKQGVNRPVRQKWAVVIGVSKFSDSRLNSNDESDKSARKFHDYLVDPKGGRFKADHVRLLTDENATQQTINNSLGPLWLGRLAGPDDLVVIYIATKAFPTTDGNSYLCSYNCRLDNIFGTCTSIQTLMQLLKESVKSDRVVLVLESAYSGGAQLTVPATSTRNATEKITSNGSSSSEAKQDAAQSLIQHSSKTSKQVSENLNVDLAQIALGKGFIILSSSSADQLSWKDLFTENLISSLKENAGNMPLNEAFSKARQKTEYDSVYRMVGGKRQTPQLKSDWKGNDLVIGCIPVDETPGLPQSVINFAGAEAHYLAANRLIISNKLDEALKEYKSAISTDPELSDAIADYAVALTMKDQWSEAEVEMRKALTVRPKDVLYLTNFARILDKLGRKDECKKALEKAYVLNPKDRVVLMALSDKCIASGDRQTAMQLIDQTLVLYPDNALAHDRMAFLLSMEGRNAESLIQAKEAVRLDPELISARLKLGSLLVINGDIESGIKEYQTAVKQSPQNPDAHFLLAGALAKVNDSQNAVKEYSSFLQLASPEDPRRTQAEDKLKAFGALITQ